MRRIVLVRHCLTEYNIVGPEARFCGRSDPPLSGAGLNEARDLSKRLSDVDVSVVYSSPLRRALETATMIADTLSHEVVVTDYLNEIDYGEWEGKTKGQLQLEYTDLYTQFARNPVEGHPPGGETPAECLRRAKNWLSTIQGECVLAVGHKTCFRLLICELLGMSSKKYRDVLDLKIGGVSVLVKTKTGWRLDALNLHATKRRVFGQ